MSNKKQQYMTFSEFVNQVKTSSTEEKKIFQFNEESFKAMVQYTEYLAEQLNKSINYSEYLAEQINEIVDYLNIQSNNSFKDYYRYLNEGKSLNEIIILLRKNKIDKLLNE